MNFDVIITGGGAAGCFASIQLSEFRPGTRIAIIEAGKKILSKVEVSGGGRCNVTHACYDPEELITYYPRGQRELLGPFYSFQPSDMISWLDEHGVIVKTEDDGRIFPITDNSETIIQCFKKAMSLHGVNIMTSTRVTSLSSTQTGWEIKTNTGTLTSKVLMIATGSDQRMWDHLESSGHTIVKPVPSLFTFNIKNPLLHELMGSSVLRTKVSIPKLKLHAEGPMLITHWGLSGPAILKLSAWGARQLFDVNYQFDISVNWIDVENEIESIEWWEKATAEHRAKKVYNLPTSIFTSRLWKYLCNRAGFAEETTIAQIDIRKRNQFLELLRNDIYKVTGKSTFKEEFVTAGGVELKEIDFTKFASRKVERLYLAGEVLNIDALTGGFNFQAAWTGAHLAAKGIAKELGVV